MTAQSLLGILSLPFSLPLPRSHTLKNKHTLIKIKAAIFTVVKNMALEPKCVGSGPGSALVLVLGEVT